MKKYIVQHTCKSLIPDMIFYCVSSMHYEINACAIRLIHLMRGKNFSFNAGTKHDKYSVTACTLNKLKQKETTIFALYIVQIKSQIS